MEQAITGKWNWRKNWADILFWVVIPTLLFAMIWIFIYELGKDKEEKQAHAALVEQTSFEVSGEVEVFREEKTIKTVKGLLGNFVETAEKSYVTVGGTEYLLEDALGVVLESGQDVVIKGYDGTVREIIILK